MSTIRQYDPTAPEDSIRQSIEAWLAPYFDGNAKNVGSLSSVPFPLIDSTDTKANGFHFGRAQMPNPTGPTNILHTTFSRPASRNKPAPLPTAPGTNARLHEDSWTLTFYCSSSGNASADVDKVLSDQIADALALLLRTPEEMATLHQNGMYDQQLLSGPNEIPSPGRHLVQLISTWRCSTPVAVAP